MPGDEAEGIARVVWEANRQLQIRDGEDWADEPWDAAPEWRRRLCESTVGLVLTGELETPGQAHEFWAIGMTTHGWTLGEKDLERKTHPSIRPWAELSPREQLGQRILFQITNIIRDSEDYSRAA